MPTFLKQNAALSRTSADEPWDISIGSTGDIESDQSFDTDITIALFSDRRADKSQVSQPERRRGWLGDEYSPVAGYAIGSRLWLLERSRLTSKTANQARDYVREALQIFIDLGTCQRINVTSRTIGFETLEIRADFIVDRNVVKSYTFRMWENSRYAS